MEVFRLRGLAGGHFQSLFITILKPRIEQLLVVCKLHFLSHFPPTFPSKESYFALGSGHNILLKTRLLNAGDDAFLPRLTLRFPADIHYIKVLQNVSCASP